MPLDYTQFGGVLVKDAGTLGLKTWEGGEDSVWNFGRIISPASTLEVEAKLRQAGNPPSAYDMFPPIKMSGANKTTMLSHRIRKVLGGNFLNSQNQPRGTCVSRGAKRIVDLCQALAISYGASFKFDYTSHAYIYGTCRQHGGFLSYQDGAVGAWAAWAVANDGNLRNSDVNDDDNDDDLAVQWGAKGVPESIKVKGRVHLIKRVVPIKTYQEARDWIASGIGGVTVASGIGYEGERDSNGVVRARGRWNHQMCYTDQREDSTMKALLQNQSWGPQQPRGPYGSIEIPSYSWWTLEDDVRRQLAENDAFGFAWLDLFDTLPDVSYRP